MANESTPDRILSTALRLFNRFGVDRVPVYKIAAEIGISPGNLTYHFPRKQDILYRLVDDLEAEAAQVLTAPRSPGVAEMAAYLVGLFQLMWRYHFFFDSLMQLAAADERIASSHARIREIAQRGSIHRIETALASGDIPPIEAPSSSSILAENMWAVWISRLGAGRPRSDEEGEDNLVVYDCCVHHLSLIQPYAGKRYIKRLHETVQEMLGVADQTEVAAT